MECSCYLRSIQKLLSDGTPYERRFGIPFNGPVKQFGAEITSVRSKSLARKIPRLCVVRRVNLERRHNARRH